MSINKGKLKEVVTEPIYKNEKLKSAFKKEAQDAELIYKKLMSSGYVQIFRKGWHLPPKGFTDKQNHHKWLEYRSQT